MSDHKPTVFITDRDLQFCEMERQIAVLTAELKQAREREERLATALDRSVAAVVQMQDANVTLGGERDRLAAELATRTAERDFAQKLAIDVADGADRIEDELRAELAQVHEALAAVEWADLSYDWQSHRHVPTCFECEGKEPNHAPGCIVGKALGRFKP